MELSRVIVKPCGRDRFELVRDFYFWDEREEGLRALGFIPAGFVTNGADIPRIFWSLWPPNSPEYLTAVVIHDYFCERARTREDYIFADRIFRRALRALGVSHIKANIFYFSCFFFHSIKCLLGASNGQ